jgi:hypothetical protein
MKAGATADVVAEPREHLGIATSMYREMDMPFWLETAGAELAGLQ